MTMTTTMLIKKSLITIFSTLLLSSCGLELGGALVKGISDVDFDQFLGTSTGANDFIINDLIGGISFVEVGPGKALFNGTLANGGSSAHAFNIKTKVAEGKILKFYFNADKTLTNGIIVSLTKVGDKAEIGLEINGSAHSIETELSSDNIMDLVIDVHNDHEDAHILIWDANGPKGDAEECVETGDCLYNTEYFTDPNPGPWGDQGKGPGVFWGFEGDNTLIIEVSGPNEALSNA